MMQANNTSNKGVSKNIQYPKYTKNSYTIKKKKNSYNATPKETNNPT